MLVALWLSLLPWLDDPRWLSKGQGKPDMLNQQHSGGANNESLAKMGIQPVEEVALCLSL